MGCTGQAQLLIVNCSLLIDIRGIDVRRVVRYLGTLTSEEYAPIREGLTQLFGL